MGRPEALLRSGTLALLASVAAPACTDLVSDPFDYGAIDVHTVTRSGEPVPDVYLLLYNGLRDVDVARSDSSGGHRFGFLPPHSYGVYAAAPDGYLRPEQVVDGPNTQRIDRIPIEEGTTQEVTFTYLKVGPGRLEVGLIEPDGSGITGVPVDLYTPAAWVETQKSDSAGLAVFEQAPFGIVGVAVHPRQAHRPPGESVVYRQSILIEGGVTQRIDIELPSCDGSLHVRVEGPAGEPVGGAGLRLYRFEGEVGFGDTDASGAHTFTDVECFAAHGVSVTPPPGYAAAPGVGSSYIDGIEVAEGEEVSVTFTLQASAP